MQREAASTLRAVVFDVDGTLAETERHGHRVAYNRAFQDLGLPYVWSEQEYRGLLLTAGGLPRTVGYLRSRGADQQEAERLGTAVHLRAVEHFLDWVHSDAVLRPGLEPLLHEAASAGLPLAVATAGRSRWVHPFLAAVAPGVPFAAVVTYDDVERGKPDPQPYEVALERLGVPGWAALGVEDSEVGLRSARGAGLSCLVVPAYYTRGQDFSGAAAVLAGFDGLTVARLREIHASAAP
jgi:HAD superfamily hydrolase (TIGR01509 family)